MCSLSPGIGGTVIIMFFNFFTAFNTIHPLLLSKKLLRMGVTTSNVSRISDYLSEKPQFGWWLILGHHRDRSNLHSCLNGEWRFYNSDFLL